MTAMAATFENMPLVFARSESKTVGFWGNLIDKLRDNSPRVVGTMKIAMDATMGWAGISGMLGIGTAVVPGAGFLIGYAALAIIGRIIMIAWGTKDNQRKTAEKHADENNIAKNTFEKTLRPKEYPMEAAAGISVVAETSGVAFGATQLAATDWTKGYTSLLLGLVAVWSYANLLFGKEKSKHEVAEETKHSEKQPGLHFATSKSKTVGWFGKLRQTMKYNPVLTSSLTNVALCIAAVMGGSLEGQSFWYVAAFVMGAIANGVQALLVKKREFNIEGALEDKQQPQTHAEKIERKRQNKDLGDNMTPAFA